jgi:hypothetical protein
MNLLDHPECSYVGVMYQQLPGQSCATIYSWPRPSEISAVDYYMWNGP